MEYKRNLVIIDFFKQLLNVYEFELYVTNNSENEKVFMLNDMQGGNLGGIEQESFFTLADVMERLEIYHNDYIYRSLEDRKNNTEIIPKNDWDLIAKRYIESKNINKILNQICATKYEEIQNYLPNFDIDETISILNEEIKDQFPLIEKYIIDNETDFYDYFSLEQLKDFEESLHLYYETDDIDTNEWGELYSKSNTPFNHNIISLSEGMIDYNDFISDYKETPDIATYDVCLSEVAKYFRENQIKNLMEYGSDRR